MIENKCGPSKKSNNEIVDAQFNAGTIVVPHPDLGWVEWISNQLLIIIPRITNKFWDQEKFFDIKRKLEAEIDFLYKRID